MKWLFWGLFILAAGAVGVFAAGYYLLPPTLQVSRTVTIARPVSVIYPLLTDLRTFNEFSPWFDRDPKADYFFEGPASGVGQTASWTSSVADLGSGQITVVKTIENKEVDTRIELGAGPLPFVQPPRILSRFDLAPDKDGAKITWSTRTTCPSRPTAVPCRIMAKLAHLQLGSQFEEGLAKLRDVAEELPAVDIADLKPERVAAESRPFAYKETAFPKSSDDFRAALREAFSVREYLTKNGVQDVGAPLALTVRDEKGGAVVRSGASFEGPAPALPEGVRLAKTPGGPVLRVTYVGPYSGMASTYAKLDAYIRAHRMQLAGEPWEVYLDDPDKTEIGSVRTEIYVPVR
jgi:effector-binding domain-containing protein